MCIRDRAPPEQPAQGGEPPEKKFKYNKNEDQKNQSDCSTYFKRVAQGKMVRASPLDIEVAKNALREFTSLQPVQKTAFAAKFAETKKSKDFSWTRDYKETLTASDKETKTYKQNHYTRIANNQSCREKRIPMRLQPHA